MSRPPFNVFGYPPATIERARERGVHPADIQETRDDYFRVFFSRIPPFRMVSGLGRGAVGDMSAFYNEPESVIEPVMTT